MPNTLSQNQHYVPQFILRRFHSDGGRLHVYDKWSRRSFVSCTRNVAAEKGFYDITIDDAVVTLEPVMCEIENAAIGAINTITDDTSLASVSEQEKNALAHFFGTQVVRTRSARDMLKQMQDGFRKVLPEKHLQESELPTGFFMDDAELKISSLRNLGIADELAPHFLDKAWLLNHTPPECSFYISDNPLVRKNYHSASPLAGNNGLACPGIQIHMPLSPSIAVSFICDTLVTPIRKHKRDNMAPEETIPLLKAIDSGQPLLIAPESVVHLNSLQVAHANRFIFASSDDFGLVDEMLESNPELAKPPQLVVR